jgi:hypothetical protein
LFFVWFSWGIIDYLNIASSREDISITLNITIAPNKKLIGLLKPSLGILILLQLPLQHSVKIEIDWVIYWLFIFLTKKRK